LIGGGGSGGPSSGLPLTILRGGCSWDADAGSIGTIGKVRVETTVSAATAAGIGRRDMGHAPNEDYRPIVKK
jgi:hypothetical protein